MVYAAFGAVAVLGGCRGDASQQSQAAPTDTTSDLAPSSAATAGPTSSASTTTTASIGLADPPVELVQTIVPADGFDQPASVAIDDERDRLYVVDSDNGRIVSFARDGTGSAVIEADGRALNFRDEGSLGAVDVDLDGNLYVAESGTQRILHMTSDGRLLSEFKPDPHLGRLFSVSVDRTNDLVYVVDDVRNVIVVFDSDGTEIRRLASRGSKPGQVEDVGSVEVLADGTLWVADAGNSRVQHLSADGSVLQVIGPFAAGEPGAIEYPNDVAVDPAGRIWVADYRGHAVVVFGPDGTPLARLAGEGDQSLWTPTSLTFDDAGRLYLAERNSDAVYVYNVPPA